MNISKSQNAKIHILCEFLTTYDDNNDKGDAKTDETFVIHELLQTYLLLLNRLLTLFVSMLYYLLLAETKQLFTFIKDKHLLPPY